MENVREERENNDEKMYGTFSEDLQPHFGGHAAFRKLSQRAAYRSSHNIFCLKVELDYIYYSILKK